MAFLLSVVVAALVWPVSAEADEYHWYGQNNSVCRQVGFPGPSSMSCPTVGPGYLPTPEPGNTNSGGLKWMIDGAIAPGVNVSRSGEYCNYYNTGSKLVHQNSNDQGAFTGYRPPQPYSSWQEGDTRENVCQAVDTVWGYRVNGTSANNYCNAPFAPCGMHRWVSFADEATRNRPWADSFGAQGSLLINSLAAPNRVQVSTGAFGYVCPVLRDGSSNRLIEYCFEHWRVGSGFPNAAYDSAAACADNGRYAIDQVITRFAPNAAFATQRPGTATTYGFTGPGAREFTAMISRQDLVRAIGALNARCSRGFSTDPNDYSLHGIEVGAEGGNVTTIAGYTDRLRLSTSTDTLHANQTLQPNQALTSLDGTLRAVMQPDGNFVVYKNGNYIWQSNTYGQTGAYLIMQPDGNLVIVRNGNPVWYTSTASNAKSHLTLANDGRLILYSGGLNQWDSF